MFHWIYRIVLLLLLMFSTQLMTAQTSVPSAAKIQVPVLSIKGAIGPAVSDYIRQEIILANSKPQVLAIVLTLDTPGGLSSSLRVINQQILSSNIPILCLVYPQGARAASAGTYILYACHIAAMASATTLGAATPVMIGGGLPGGKKAPEQPSEPTAMEKKMLNDSVAYIRSLAQLRGRNEEWAELAVTEAATMSAQEALAANVINLIAQNPEELLLALDGTSITIDEHTLVLKLTAVELEYRTPDWRNQFIATITDPNIAYILMLIGIYGLLLEFYSPGIGVAGVTGAICLLVALYAFQLLPINYAGLALLILGISLLVLESLVPSFGLFGFGGLVAFIIGSIFLIDTQQEYFQISRKLIFFIAIASTLFTVFILSYFWRVRQSKVVSGTEAIIGANAEVIDGFSKQGFVLFNGERWAAISQQQLIQGQVVTINAITGLTLLVSSKNGNDRESNNEE
ncbi:MAG: serine protease [Gammaproteobacteria bacterium]|nr:MAG: serine protease [Gammaproteobacteria bacterium]PHR84797.1 MAG: serine protease [Colwellia sp.]